MEGPLAKSSIDPNASVIGGANDDSERIWTHLNFHHIFHCSSHTSSIIGEEMSAYHSIDKSQDSISGSRR